MSAKVKHVSIRTSRGVAERPPKTEVTVDTIIHALMRPRLLRCPIDPTPLAVSASMRSVRLRFRKTSGSQAVVTGDCLCNLLGYCTTSAVANRLASVVRLKSVAAWAPTGYLGGSAVDASSLGTVQISFANENKDNFGVSIPTSFTDSGSVNRPGRLKVAPPAHISILDCTSTNRWVVFTVNGPLGTIVDVSLEWSWYKADLASMYTLTTVTTTVGLSPHNSYLDNTNLSGGVGGQLLSRVNFDSSVDFVAYG